jgi:hypothetical protein
LDGVAATNDDRAHASFHASCLERSTDAPDAPDAPNACDAPDAPGARPSDSGCNS